MKTKQGNAPESTDRSDRRFKTTAQPSRHVRGILCGWALATTVTAAAATLELAFPTSVINENATSPGLLATVTADSIQEGPLTILIFNPDPTEISAPTSVTIPTGTNTVSFRIEVVNDGEIDGNQSIALAVSADGFPRVNSTLQVDDDDTVSSRTIGGRLFGDLEAGAYLVTADLTIEAGRTLTIQPAATLRFATGKGLTCSGTLLAEGDADRRIQFTSASSTPTNGIWKGITVTSTGAPQSLLNQVDISFAQTGLLVIPDGDQAHLLLRESSISRCGVDGVMVHGKSTIGITSNAVQILSNRIYDNDRHGVQIYSYVYGCDSGSVNSTTVFANEIFGNGSAGIRLNADAAGNFGCRTATRRSRVNGLIANNSIHGNLHGIWGNARKGFVASIGSLNPTIQNNLIFNNIQDGLRFDANAGAYNGAFAELYPRVVNNTVYGNGGAGIFHATNALAGFHIANNILVQNNYGIRAASEFVGDNPKIACNDVWGNGLGNWVNHRPEYGLPVTNNLNGTPADLMLNISADPIFNDTLRFELHPGSPAVDAGTTNLAPALDTAGRSRGQFPDLGCRELATAFLAGSSLPNEAGFALLLTGGRGTACSIEATADIQTWMPVTNLVLPERAHRLVLPVEPGTAHRFFRAKLVATE